MNSKTKTFIALCALSLVPASVFAYRFEGKPTLPAFAEEKYTHSYFAPSPDWVPVQPIAYYTQNVRAPQIVWVKYKGAYAPGLRIRPIEQKWLAKQEEFGLLRYNAERRKFSEAGEKDEINRTIAVGEMSEEADFTELSFKVKADVKNTDAELLVTAVGLDLTFKTAECKDVKTEADGVKVYTFPVKVNPRKKLSGLRITVSPIKGKLEDAKQEITIFDFHFKRSKPHTYVKSIAPREFIKKDSGEKVGDIYEYLSKAPAADSKAVPVKGWFVPEPEKNTGVKISTVKEKLNGQELDALRIEWTTPTAEKQRYSRIKVPFNINALDYSVLSFLYKFDIDEGVPVRGDKKLSRIPQYLFIDNFGDNPGISFGASGDRFDYNIWAVTRSHIHAGKRTSAGIPKGWNFFAFDMVHDDPTGNKGFSLDKITSCDITLRNAVIPAGKKVVMTIILPKFTKGLMYTGGDMELYRQFAKWKEEYKPLPYKEALKIPYFKDGMLKEPIPVMKDRMLNLEIIHGVRNNFSARFLEKYLTRILNPLNGIPIYWQKGSKQDNVKIYLGTTVGMSKELAAKVTPQIKSLNGTPGYLICAEGKNIYIVGGDMGRDQREKGTLNGVLDFLEYNLGLMFPRARMTRGANPDTAILEEIIPNKIHTDYAFTWGNRLHKPEMKYWGFSNGNEQYSYLNRASYWGCWYNPDIVADFAAYRSYSANHWFGFGATKRLPDGKFDQSAWGRRKDGTPYQPGCYTGSPCLVRVIDAGKDDFLNDKFFIINYKQIRWAGRNMARFNDDSAPVWIEDTWNTCECSECLSPFRLPDGTLITTSDPDYKAEWHIVNATAYNQMVRVYANRNMELNYLIYFFTIPVPRTPLTKYMRAHFCPYVRADYDQPIYAPVNDKFWRIITQWAAVSRTMGVSDYFLGGWFRPSADVQSAEMQAMSAVGVKWFGQETETNDASVPEMWVSNRMIWEPQWDPDALRAYYCSKVYGAGGEDVYNFYAKLRRMRYDENRGVDFEDYAEMGFLAMKTPATKTGVFGKKYASLAEELTADLERAAEKTENDPVAKFFVEKVRKAWDIYLEKAKAPIK